MISQTTLTNFTNAIEADMAALPPVLPDPPPESWPYTQTQVTALLAMLQTAVTSGAYPDLGVLGSQGNAANGGVHGLEAQTAPDTPAQVFSLLQHVNNLLFSVEQDVNSGAGSVQTNGVLTVPPGGLGSVGRLITQFAPAVVSGPPSAPGLEAGVPFDPGPPG